MAMVRNESVARILMWLCFGTAILSLAVHWRITTAARQFDQLASANGSPPKNITGKPSQPSTSKLSNTQPTAVNTNVVEVTGATQKQRLGMPERKQNSVASNLPQSLFPIALAQQKTSKGNQLVQENQQVVVNLSDRRAYVYRNDVVIASYPIAIGKKGWETPTGTFQISHMQHNPIWRHPITDQVFAAGPDSPLGDRWIGFWSDGHNHIGFHGTPDTETMGSAISHGCIRMRNPDVRLLYEQVGLGTTVIVRN
jgi:lipoprotein-anchoring transpeptidase ErfK/SrfK